MPIDTAGSVITVVDDTFYLVGGGHNIFTMDSTIVMQYTPFTNFAFESDSSVIPLVIVILIVFVSAGLGLLVYLIKKKS